MAFIIAYALVDGVVALSTPSGFVQCSIVVDALIQG